MIPRPRLTSTEFVLDTNVAIDFINHPQESLARVPDVAILNVPTIVLGELFFGARKSSRFDENAANVEHFAASSQLIVVDIGVSRCFGDIQHFLRSIGRPISENDMWIAACAISRGLPLATADNHFRSIKDLTILDW